jgi:hypothetical protein
MVPKFVSEVADFQIGDVRWRFIVRCRQEIAGPMEDDAGNGRVVIGPDSLTVVRLPLHATGLAGCGDLELCSGMLP